MRTRTVAYKDDGYDVELVVRQMSLGGGFRRLALRSREAARFKERFKEPGEDAANYLQLHWVAHFMLPACLGATEIKNLDADKIQVLDEMDLDDFLALPEAMVILWENAVYECNPHWMPRMKEDEQGEAREPGDDSSSTESSSPGSSTKSPKMSLTGI